MLVLFACTSAPRLAPRGAEHGIEVVAIRLTGGGDLAKLEYRVIDLEKARRALGGDLSIVGTNVTTPLPVLSAGRLGALRQRPSATGKRQYVLFRNAGLVLRPGDTAALLVGDERVEGIPVS